MADVTSVVSGTGKAIGRYFSVVSVLPSILLVVYVFLLVSSGSWRHSPNWHDAFVALRNLGLVGAALLAVAGITIALVLHPLQFSMVQLLEGYWGTGRLAQQIRVSRIHRYRKRKLLLSNNESKADSCLKELGDKNSPLAKLPEDEKLDLRVRLLSKRDEAARSGSGYPEDPNHIMPTRLGNILRRYEVLAGAPYKLDAPTILPSLALVTPPAHLEYLNDQRSALDLAVRTCMTAAIACLVTILFFWHSGLWLLVALIPYGVTYAAYRGSVIAAENYGITMSAVIALNRFALYEYLHAPRPMTTNHERQMNATLMALLRDYDEEASHVYRYPKESEGPQN
jgi:hypothetical protein